MYLDHSHTPAPTPGPQHLWWPAQDLQKIKPTLSKSGQQRDEVETVDGFDEIGSAPVVERLGLPAQSWTDLCHCPLQVAAKQAAAAATQTIAASQNAAISNKNPSAQQQLVQSCKVSSLCAKGQIWNTSLITLDHYMPW